MTRFTEETTARLSAVLARHRTRRQIIGAGIAAAGSLIAFNERSRAAPVEPADTPTPDPWNGDACVVPTPAAGSAADAGATPSADDFVAPIHIVIPAISLNAPVEVLGVVDGALQNPTDGDTVAWYKETGRPGKKGNAVFAGHLDWYGQPQAIFFSIDQLKEGDEIIVRDMQCGQFTYKVEHVELVPVADADMDQITGDSDQKIITLITCGGSWDPDSSEYLSRTVVRGKLADSGDDDDASSDGTPTPDTSIGQPIGG